MVKQLVNITLDKDLLYTIEQYISKQEIKPTRSAFFARAVDYYLKVHCGIPYIISSKKKQREKNAAL